VSGHGGRALASAAHELIYSGSERSSRSLDDIERGWSNSVGQGSPGHQRPGASGLVGEPIEIEGLVLILVA
jgi:hypothetical protein